MLKQTSSHGGHSGAASLNFLCPPNFVVTRKICFKHLIRQKSWPPKVYLVSHKTLKHGSKLSLNHVSAIMCSQVRESYRQANINSVSSLLNWSNFDDYTVL